jgi:hypothetical protein
VGEVQDYESSMKSRAPWCWRPVFRSDVSEREDVKSCKSEGGVSVCDPIWHRLLRVASFRRLVRLPRPAHLIHPYQTPSFSPLSLCTTPLCNVKHSFVSSTSSVSSLANLALKSVVGYLLLNEAPTSLQLIDRHRGLAEATPH